MARTNRGFITQPLATAPADMPLGEAFGHAMGGSVAVALGAGVFLLLSQKADPAEAAGVRLFGAVFVLFGLLFIRYGLKNGFAVMAARRRANMAERWQRDWNWAREAPATSAGIVPSAITLAIYAAIVAPFNVVWTAPWTFYRVVVGALDLVGVALLGHLLWRVLRWLRFGRARVTWHSFPAIVGGRLEGFVQTARRVSDAPARLTLSAIREQAQSAGDNALELWAETLEVRGREGRYDFSFALPNDIGATKLSSATPLYWKLTVAIPTPGPDFGCEFMAPVYSHAATIEAAPSSQAEDDAAQVVRVSGSPDAGRRTLTVSTVVFGGLGIALAWFGGGMAYENLRVWNTPYRVDGVVVDQVTSQSRDSRGRSTTMYAAVVRYEVNGQSYRTTQEIASGSPMYATGATVTVAYDPANPGAGRILGVLELFFMSGLLLIVSLACFAAAAASGRARRSIKKRR
jgi:hypothetical protein